MAGLLSEPPVDDEMALAPNQGPTGPNPEMPGAPPAPDESRVPDDDEGEPNVSPEEQEAYEQFVANGMEVLYGGEEPGVRPDILQRLRESSDPLENLANTSVWLTTMLETSAESNGAQLDDAVVFHGGRAMFEELIEIADAAKIHDYQEKEIEGAWYRALDLYRETATEQGRIDPEALKEQFNTIEEADRQGRMGDVLPGLSSEAAPGKAPAAPAA